MTTDIHSQRPPEPHQPTERSSLLAMLEARSVAIVGASKREGSFGERMLAEAVKSPAKPIIYPVNPRYAEIGGRPCYPSLARLPEPVDLALLGVPDAALEAQLTLAASHGCKSAVIFGNAHEDTAGGYWGVVPPASTAAGYRGVVPPASTAAGYPEVVTPASSAHPAQARPSLRQRLAAIARSAGMELCGAGCMGFANVSHGLRAMGYVEPDPLPAGPVALVTHSGSVFSTMLRSRRAFGFTLAVSSGQELVTAAPSYLSYALDVPDTKVIGLILEAMRQPGELRKVLTRAAERNVPVVLLTAGNSASGRAMVAAHSGALAGSDGGWEALVRYYGIHRVSDLAEMADALELFTLRATRRTGRSPNATSDGRGIATVHDSGLERAHTADVADEVGLPFAAISNATKAKLEELLDPGLQATNPLDVWGTGAGTRELFAGSLTTLAEDESVDAVALAVDLITELDGDTAYQLAVLDTASRTDKPVVVLASLPGAIDPDTAMLLRSSGVPVLEGLRSGLVALRHLLQHQDRPAWREPAGHVADQARLDRARKLLAHSGDSGTTQLALLREYGIPAAAAERVNDAVEALDAAARIGYPVVLKTDQPGVAHKSDAGGVILGIAAPAELKAAYTDLARRLGPAALICESVPRGTELALGLVRDPDLGPLIVVGAGGTLVELIADRAVALPPVSDDQAAAMLAELKVSALLAGARGGPPADLAAIVSAITGLAELACELGQDIDALDINPLICGPDGAIAVDALVIPR